MYTYVRMYYILFSFNNLTNNIYFYNKIAFNFKCIHAFAWVTCIDTVLK